MTRTTCRSCDSSKLKNILSLGDLYLSDFTKTPRLPKKFPIDLVLCEVCFLLQTKETVSPKLLYTERYGYRSGINTTMKKELQEIAKRAMKIAKIKKGDIVIDIGANDGTSLSYYNDAVIKIGVEPVKKLAHICNEHADYVINTFFSKKAVIKNLPKSFKKKQAKIITAISMFYDLEKPNEFVSDLQSLLAPDGVLIIQQNYLGEMLKQNAFCNIVHEHLEYYSLTSMEYLFNKHNLSIFHVELSDINGGSFRTYICHKDSRPIRDSVLAMRKSEEKMKINNSETYFAFVKRIEKIKNDLYTFINEEVKKGKKIYALGASTRGNTLLQFYNLDKKLITAAVERNPEKWGTYIASVGIPIISEEQARKEKPEYMLVLPWFFKDEIVKREKKYLDAGGHLIFPLPQIQII